MFGLTQNHFRKLAFELAERNIIAHNFNKTNGLAGELSNDYFYLYILKFIVILSFNFFYVGQLVKRLFIKAPRVVSTDPRTDFGCASYGL